MKTKAIVTIPPYADYIDHIIKHPIVSGIRLNTVMPTKGKLEDLLKKLSDISREKDLWIDLKGRQLRTKGYWVPPFTEVELTHSIKADTPATAIFSDGKEYATILEIDGNRLIMQDGPRRVVGPGESLNIKAKNLTIEGYFTETDMRYIEAGEKTGVKNYMLSFIESKKDIDLLKNLYSDAEIIAKIESKKGLDYVINKWNNEARLMTARGDLYLELDMPHEIIKASEIIVQKDNNAIVASRIFNSLSYQEEISSQDIGDVDSLMRMGYKNFMFGDYICMQKESIISGLNLLYKMAESYEK
ncbi:MAG: pyruvate kinase [Nanoarchaeota archaeon]